MRQLKFISVLCASLLSASAVNAMPVEDFATEQGVWTSFAQVVNTATNTAQQVSQGYAMIGMTQQQLKNFDLQNINNMQDAFSKVNQATKVGNSIVSTSSDGINVINDWTRDADNPDGRVSALNSVMDTAKATLNVAGQQAEFMKQEAGDISNISNASQTVSGQTQAVQAGNQLMQHLNGQVQSVNSSIQQQNALIAAAEAQRTAKAMQYEKYSKTLGQYVRNLGSPDYVGQTVPTNWSH
jgi:conjugal transfer/entry exclusion protein